MEWQQCSVLYELYLLLTPVASGAAKSTRTSDLKGTLLRQQNRKQHMMETCEGIKKSKKNIFLNKTEKTAPPVSACENKGWMNDIKANTLPLEHPLPIPIVSLFDKCCWLRVSNTSIRRCPCFLPEVHYSFLFITLCVCLHRCACMQGRKKANIHECNFLCVCISSFLQTGAEEPFN